MPLDVDEEDVDEDTACKQVSVKSSINELSILQGLKTQASSKVLKGSPLIKNEPNRFNSKLPLKLNTQQPKSSIKKKVINLFIGENHSARKMDSSSSSLTETVADVPPNNKPNRTPRASLIR
jgi:hypothetical protein